MAWTAEDKERIRKVLKLPPTKLVGDALQISMDNLTRNFPAAIETVQEALDELESNRTSRKAVYTADGYAIEEVDVVRYGNKGAGLELWRYELLQEIAIAMNLSVDWLQQSIQGDMGRS
jgi:hypothetical protein